MDMNMDERLDVYDGDMDASIANLSEIGEAGGTGNVGRGGDRQRRSFDFGQIFGCPTGEGSIDGYIEHPLNPFKSRGLAQVLRGATGIAGDLALAIIDIGVGAFNFLKELKGGPKSDNEA